MSYGHGRLEEGRKALVKAPQQPLRLYATAAVDASLYRRRASLTQLQASHHVSACK